MIDVKKIHINLLSLHFCDDETTVKLTVSTVSVNNRLTFQNISNKVPANFFQDTLEFKRETKTLFQRKK